MDVLGVCPLAIEVISFRWMLIGVIATLSAIIGMRVPIVAGLIYSIVSPILAFAKYILVTIAGVVSISFLYKMILCVV